MANRGIGFFDSKGQFHKTPEDATMSDIAALLGRMGEGDSLAPGIAKIILDKRREIESILSDHDKMVLGMPTDNPARIHATTASDGQSESARPTNVTPLQRPSGNFSA